MTTNADIEDGYRLWLRYPRVSDPVRLKEYRRHLATCDVAGDSPTLAAARVELTAGLGGLLGQEIQSAAAGSRAGRVVAGTVAGLAAGGPPVAAAAAIAAGLADALGAAPPDSFVVRHLAAGEEGGASLTVVTATTELGVLYGVFALLRHLQSQRPLEGLRIDESPRLSLRMLDHWDNLDGTIERGYAGASLWDWEHLPGELSPRYRDYARANASVGINALTLNNVNANALILTAPYLAKVSALAQIFRPYGQRVFLSARFSAPVDLGALPTADPLVPAVAAWWREKAAEIYRHIPDFGGFLVKANSEGQPGPQDYGRTHADGANMLAKALASGGGAGRVLWRAFVYRQDVAEDRAKQAYLELVPLDGAFAPNVSLQVKNGPIDFQPREPFHPLFGAMSRTPLLAEFQLAQEYLGCATHLAYLGPLVKETLDGKADGAATVAEILAGLPGGGIAGNPGGGIAGNPGGGIAAVANSGSDRNWCGHPFAAANWFAFGRLAWDPRLDPTEIADDWLRMTFSNAPEFVAPLREVMMASREAVVNYMTPLGLHHIMAKDHHYGPGPWVDSGRPDWTSVYYHRADQRGIGFDRSASGSNAVAQYQPPWPALFGDAARCPENLLLWFHHLPWDHRMSSGRTLWDELCLRYQSGVDGVRSMQAVWRSVAADVDDYRFRQVEELLAIQEREACWWRDACVLYFQTFSGRPRPPGCEAPRHALDHYQSIQHHKVPRPPAPPGGHEPSSTLPATLSRST